MNPKYLPFAAVILLFALVVMGRECNPPELPPGSRWVANDNCTSGTVYEKISPAPRERCHCWGHCGYICSPKNSTGGTTTTTTTTTPTTTTTTQRTTTQNSSPCPHGPIWYNPEGQRCHCQSYNQTPYYVCEDTTTTTSTTTTTTQAPTSSTTTASTTTASTTTASTTTPAAG